MWKCVKLMDIYVHPMATFPTTWIAQIFLQKQGEINPFENVIMHMCACMCMNTHTQEDAKFTKCIR